MRRWAFLLFLVQIAYIEGTPWNALSSTWGSFFNLPLTLSDAQREGWVQPHELNQHRRMTLCRLADPEVCLVFNKHHGSLAGYQISIPRAVDFLKMPGMDYRKNGYKTITLFGQPRYAFTVYFVPPGSKEFGGLSKSVIGTGLWITIQGKLVQIPKNINDLSRNMPIYKRGNCFDQMGLHYFFNMTPELKPQEWSPIFLLYSKTGALHGFGHDAYGSVVNNNTVQSSQKRKWFENSPRGATAIRAFVPNSPDWLVQYMDNYGGFRHHVYLTQNPQGITCNK